MKMAKVNNDINWLLLPLFLLTGMVIGWLLHERISPDLLLDRTGLRPEAPFVIPPEAQGELALFVLAGQSNMSGRGELSGESATHPQVFLFGNDYRWHLAQEPLDHTRDQVDLVSMESPNDDAGYSPGMAFALRLLADRPALDIGLIPCAKGGTTLAEWAPARTTTTLYGSCLQRIYAARSQGQIAGILFFQGENDALPADAFPAEQKRTANGYSDLFGAWVEQLRLDLEQPALPIVFAQIGTNERPDIFVNWQIVQAEQAAIDLPCTAMITTRDLALRDAVHFSSASYDVIGERFADAYLQLRQAPDCEG